MPQTVTSEITTTDDNEEWTVLSVTAHVTVSIGKTIVLADATSGAITVTLPPAGGVNQNRMISVKKVDSSVNVVTVDGDSSETIDGATTHVLSSQYDSVMMVSDGSNWLAV